MSGSMSATDEDLQQQLCDFVQQAILHPQSSEYEQYDLLSNFSCVDVTDFLYAQMGLCHVSYRAPRAATPIA